MMRWLSCLLLASMPALACVGSTGSNAVTFAAYASGPADHPRGDLVFDGLNARVTLTAATLHVGAAYLTQRQPISGAQPTGCIAPGVYVGEVRAGRDIDVLSPIAQEFPVFGHGTTDRAGTGEVWLGDAPIDDDHQSSLVADITGFADRVDGRIAFHARVTIGPNRLSPPLDPALPGSAPLCKQRIATNIPTSVLPAASGALLLTIDPRGWFSDVDWSAIPAPASGTFEVPDDDLASYSRALAQGLRASSGVYSFAWISGPP